MRYTPYNKNNKMVKLTQEQIDVIVELLETLKEPDSQLIGTRPKDR